MEMVKQHFVSWTFQVPGIACGWTNPWWKICASQILDHFPKVRGENKKNETTLKLTVRTARLRLPKRKPDRQTQPSIFRCFCCLFQGGYTVYILPSVKLTSWVEISPSWTGKSRNSVHVPLWLRWMETPGVVKNPWMERSSDWFNFLRWL